MVPVILVVSLMACLASDNVSAQPVALLRQQSAILKELNSNLSPYDFWNLMMIETWSAEQNQQAEDEIVFILQEQFDRVNGGHIHVSNEEEFRRLYDKAVAMPCNYIKSVYNDNRAVFESPSDTKQYDEIALYKDIAQVCDNVLLDESKQDEFFKRMARK